MYLNKDAILDSLTKDDIKKTITNLKKSYKFVKNNKKQGELLVSGLYDSQTQGFRYTRAAGRILARTERTVRVEIPLEYVQKCYIDEKIGSITLNFFQKSTNICLTFLSWIVIMKL